jgi:hypothetical protein
MELNARLYVQCDLVKNPCNEEVMNEYCREHGFTAWFTTSGKPLEDDQVDSLSCRSQRVSSSLCARAAKENVNVDEAVTSLVGAISKRTGGTGGAAAPAPSQQQQETIKVSGAQQAGSDAKESGCGC